MKGNQKSVLERQRRQRGRMNALLGLVLLLILAGLALLAWRGWPQSTAGRGSTGQGSGTEVVGVASVTDGDTLEIQGTKIRLFGVDAPESTQTCTRNRKTYPCGREAANALAGFLGQQTVRCRRKDTDRYGRLVAVCHVGNTDVNGWLVQSGYALAYREYGTDYVPQETAARKAKRGIHAGTFVNPADYRKGKTTPSIPTTSTPAKSPYPSCAVARSKGRTPVLRGEPGYNPRLDGDQDGKMCE